MTIPTITMVPVQSGAITAIGYDPESKSLDVQFQSGDTHRHEGVTPEQADAFYAAESKGKHYHQNIRGKFTSSKVQPSAREMGECLECGARGTVGVTCQDCGCGVYQQ